MVWRIAGDRVSAALAGSEIVQEIDAVSGDVYDILD